MKRALWIQKQLLLHSLYSSKSTYRDHFQRTLLCCELDSLQFYLWKCYKVNPFYPTELEYRFSISRFAKQVYDPSKTTHVYSNGNVIQNEFRIMLPFHISPDYVRLPQRLPNSIYSCSKCSLSEARYIQLLFWIAKSSRKS